VSPLESVAYPFTLICLPLEHQGLSLLLVRKRINAFAFSSLSFMFPTSPPPPSVYQAGAVLFHPDLTSSGLTVSDNRRTVTKSSNDQHWDMAVCPIGLGTVPESAAPASAPSSSAPSLGGYKPRLGRSGSSRSEER
jgi:hypothetical protein